MKLSIGKKYNFILKNSITFTGYYTGYHKDCNYSCYCCNKELWNVHEFLIPTNSNANYTDCFNGEYSEVVHLGVTCIKKIKIEME